MEEKVLCRIHYDTMVENLKRAAESGKRVRDMLLAPPVFPFTLRVRGKSRLKRSFFQPTELETILINLRFMNLVSLWLLPQC